MDHFSHWNLLHWLEREPFGQVYGWEEAFVRAVEDRLVMGANDFYFIHAFPNKKYFINKGIKIALTCIRLIELFLWILNDDARRLESIELTENRWDFLFAFAQSDSCTSMFRDAFSFRVIERSLPTTLLFFFTNSLIYLFLRVVYSAESPLCLCFSLWNLLLCFLGVCFWAGAEYGANSHLLIKYCFNKLYQR